MQTGASPIHFYHCWLELLVEKSGSIHGVNYTLECSSTHALPVSVLLNDRWPNGWTGIIRQSNTEEKKNNRRYRKTVTRYMVCHPINKCTVKVVVVFVHFRVLSTLVYVQ